MAESFDGVIRPCIQRVAMALELRLRKNDHKEGWQDMTLEECLGRANDERRELLIELTDKENPQLKNIRHELEDEINFLVFGWNNAAQAWD